MIILKDRITAQEARIELIRLAQEQLKCIYTEIREAVSKQLNCIYRKELSYGSIDVLRHDGYTVEVTNLPTLKYRITWIKEYVMK